jgi:TonB-dependent SusC/RagA subfamily outer membrane receptor
MLMINSNIIKISIISLFIFSCKSIKISENEFSRSYKSQGFSKQKVDGKKLRISNEEDFNRSLAGKVSGLQILDSSSSTFEPTQVMIRGEKNILYLVDGIKMNPEDINPAIIESVEVIKGPSAASRYGNEAINGVILISTKKKRN